MTVTIKSSEVEHIYARLVQHGIMIEIGQDFEATLTIDHAESLLIDMREAVALYRSEKRTEER